MKATRGLVTPTLTLTLKWTSIERLNTLCGCRVGTVGRTRRCCMGARVRAAGAARC